MMRRERRVELTSALDGDELAAVEKSTIDPGLDHLNAELTKDKNAAD